LAQALVAFMDPRTPSRIFSLLQGEGRSGLARRLAALSFSEREKIHARAESMATKGIFAVCWGDAGYPSRLGRLASSSPILFCWGNSQLLDNPGLGMCGSRKASDLGLKAAALCGEDAQDSGLAVVSGYAKGVDTETHLAAVGSGGKTVIVVPEGIDNFRIRKDFPRHLFRRDDVLVISQFAPEQPWTAGGAMTRNRLIYGLGLALVVIEAGHKGGTLAAGEGALRAGRPVLVLDFNGSTPTGNRILLEKGGIPIPNRTRLREVIAELKSGWHVAPASEQLDLASV
jgi:DNA processing protein